MRIVKFWPFLAVFIFSLTPILWFWGKGSVLINGVDTNFPLDPVTWFARRLYVWSNVNNAGSDFSSSTAGVFFHLIQLIPYKLGFDLQSVQIISLVFWFLLVTSGSFLLARIIFPRRALVQILFVALYSYNTYLFNTWENVKVANLSLAAAVPLALSLLIALSKKTVAWQRAALFAFLIGVVLSGSGINPSYFLFFVFLVAIFVLAQAVSERGLLNPLKNFFFVFSFIILANLFWLLPTSTFVFQNISPQASIDKIGFTNWVDSLSENTSLLNVMRLQGAWDWYSFDSITGLPLYIPYALNYFYRFPFIAFSFLLPSFALLAFLLRKKEQNHLYLSFALMFFIGIFLGAGTHLPTGNVFRWFLNHIPFFTLFRSPWYIFTPLVTLSTAGLVGFFFFNLLNKQGKKVLQPLASLAILVLILGNFLYTYPLTTGKIFRPARKDGFFIHFPEYIFDAQKWLSEEKITGRVIGYPDDEIEQFNWGYRGIESILVLVGDVEVLFAPLNAPDAPVSSLIKEFYESIKKKNFEAAQLLASKLNVAYVFEKRDQPSLAPALPEDVKKNGRVFGPWHFYPTSAEGFLPKIYSVSSLVFGYPHDKSSAKLLTTLKENETLVSPDDSVVGLIDGIKSWAGNAVLMENSQVKDVIDFSTTESRLSNRLTTRDFSRVSFSFEIPTKGFYSPLLERYRLEDFGLNPNQDLVVLINGQEELWPVSEVTDSYVRFGQREFSAGSHTISLALPNTLVLREDFTTSGSFTKSGEGEYLVQGEGDQTILSVLNKGPRDISANIAIPDFDPLGVYAVEFKYKQIYGNNATTLVSQHNPQTLVKTQVERLPNYPEWNNFSFYYQPVKTDSTARVELVAPQTKDPLGTKVLYDDLRVYKVFSSNLILVQESDKELIQPGVSFKKTSPVSYEGEVKNASDSHVLVFSENYSPNWELSIQGAKKPANLRHFSANLYANAWYLENTPETYKFKIYYKPQNLFTGSLFISLSSFVLILLLALRRPNGKN